MRSLFLAVAIMLAGSGCASRPDPRPIAEDLVCKCNGDLGCVRVRIDEKTPQVVFEGKTYYFCAESCRTAFEKDPRRYCGPARVQ
jgi:YHS domain-containing protein